MPNTLIVYATTDGQTRKISERIQQTLRDNDLETTLVDVDKAAQLDPARFDGVIAGASVRYGKHDPKMARFLDGNRDAIGRVPNAFFSVNLIARKPEKRDLAGNKYLRRFLDRLAFSPMHVEIIAGKLDYPSYRFIDRIMIRMIMKITDGPTDGTEVIEYTDWDQVDRFAGRMAEAIVASEGSADARDDSATGDTEPAGNQGN